MKLAGLLTILAVLLVGTHSVGNLNCGGHLRHDQRLIINGHTIQVQSAISDTEHNKGLGGLPCIAHDEGMLFAFDQSGYYQFWMKDMKFSLDFLWLDDNKRVVTELQGINPSSYPQNYVSTQPAKYVLELPAGQASAFGLAQGQQLSF